MNEHQKIQHKEQSIARLERQLAKAKVKQRKADTRRKIQLGGLIIKAKMDVYPKDVILGALIQAESALKEEGSRQFYQLIGKNAFLE